MISFVNFARIASICVGFHLGTLHGHFFHQDFWPNLNFLLEDQIKLVLSITAVSFFLTIARTQYRVVFMQQIIVKKPGN